MTYAPTTPAHAAPNWSFWGYAALMTLWAFALSKPILMWDWNYYHDTPLLNYAAVLMHDFGQAPYRDIFETTMPGTFLFHYIIVGLGLEGQTAFVTLGLIAMGLLAGLGAWILSRISRPAALVFPPFFLMVILQFGPTALFQREILGLLAITPALILATQTTPRYLVRQFAIGLLFGITATIKPQFALGAPVAVLTLAALTHQTGHARTFLNTAITGITASLIGFAVPLAAAFIWLWSYGALEQFWFIISEYTPLYIQQTQSHAFTTPEIRTQYLWQQWIYFAGFWTLLPGVLLLTALTFGLRAKIAPQTRIILMAICALAGIYGLLPIMSGQFWDYHYFPFIYFSILAAAALLAFITSDALSETGQIACGAALGAILLCHSDPVPNLDWHQEDAKTRVALAIEMEEALVKWVPEGGRVQPIDWAEGAIHAMMRARIPIATRFFYEFHFAHHAGHPVNTRLRAMFMEELTQDPPEVILVANTRNSVFGVGVSSDFSQFDAFQAEHYRPVAQNPRFGIYLRRDLEP